MNKLLVVCPTRERPHQCKRMVQSLKHTSCQSDFLFMVDEDDPCLPDYQELFMYEEVDYLISERKTTTELFNLAYELHPDYEFYCLTNDDFVFHTLRWDELLCRYGKICYGNDLLAGQGMPTCPVIDGDIVRAVGWLQMPGLSYMYGDAVWKLIGLKMGNLKYIPSVIIEHCHWLNHKSQLDEVYKNTNSSRVYQNDEIAYRNWHNETLETDIKKIKTLFDLRENNRVGRT